MLKSKCDQNLTSLYSVNTLSSGRVEVIKKIINQRKLFLTVPHKVLLNSFHLNDDKLGFHSDLKVRTT